MKKIFIYFLFLIFTFSKSHCQYHPIKWQKCLGGSMDEKASKVIQTKDSGYIVVGETESTNGDVTNNLNRGNTDIWIVKLNKLGVIEWQKALGGTLYDYVFDVKQTNDKGFILVGSVESNNIDVTGNHGKSDCWVVKLDSLGIVQWQKAIGGSEYDGANSVELNNDGTFVIAGYSKSNNGDATVNKGSYDVWVVKLSQNGNILWQKSYGGSEREIAYSIKKTIDGGYIVAANTNSNDFDVVGFQSITQLGNGYFTNPLNYDDCWILKLDSVGALVWKKTYQFYGDDFVFSLDNSKNGGFIFTGYTKAIPWYVQDYKFADLFICKINDTGKVIWQKTYGSNTSESGYSFVETKNGEILCLGETSTNSSNGTVAGVRGSGDAWVLKLDSSGNFLWQKPFGGTKIEYARSIQSTYDGCFVMACSSSSNDYDVSGNKGLMDFWIVKLDSSLSYLPLPIRLKSFNVISQNKTALLQWSSEIETNGKQFEIEKSVDGKTFFKIGSIPVNGISSEYNYNDENLKTLVTYYRLKMVSLEGTFEYSMTKQITINQNKLFVDIYPNPSKENTNVSINSLNNETLKIIITDLTGKILSVKTCKVSKGINSIQLNTSRFANGEYLLKVVISSEDEIITQKFIKI